MQLPFMLLTEHLAFDGYLLHPVRPEPRAVRIHEGSDGMRGCTARTFLHCTTIHKHRLAITLMAASVPGPFIPTVHAT